MLATEGLGLERKAENADGTADALNTLGNIARELGHFDEALEHYRESLTLHRAGDNVWGEAVTLNNLGTTAAYRHDYALAEQLHAESLQLRQRLGDLHGVARSSTGWPASRVRCQTRPARCATAAKALPCGSSSAIGTGPPSCSLPWPSRCAASGSSMLPPSTRMTGRSSLGHDVGDAWVVAAAPAVLGGVACDRRDWEDTARLAGAAHMHLERAGIKLRPADATRLGQDEAAARTALGESAYRCAWRIGRTIDRPRSCQP